MFSESEIDLIISNEEVTQLVDKLRVAFIEKEAPYLEISNHDFLSLVLLIPSVGKAMANNSISFGEEMSLQKKARRLSKGGFFLSKDPVVYGMKYLIKNYKHWEDDFCALIKDIFYVIFEDAVIEQINNTEYSYEQRIMRSPYALIRFISSLFLERDEDILDPGKIKKIEHEKLLELGEKIGFQEISLFKEFMERYEVK